MKRFVNVDVGMDRVCFWQNKAVMWSSGARGVTNGKRERASATTLMRPG